MFLASTLVLYLMLGGGVAGALLVRDGLPDAAGAVRLVMAWIFWPIYVPVLLTVPMVKPVLQSSESPAVTPNPLLTEIARVETELAGALQTLDGWAEGALALEEARFDELKHAWRMQAHRIHELGELLAAADDDVVDAVMPPNAVVQSVRARRENMERLKQLHQRLLDDLLGNLAWVRELVTLIHLARYTGAPASRAEELVAQIAAAVEGLSEVSDWRTAEVPVAAGRSD